MYYLEMVDRDEKEVISKRMGNCPQLSIHPAQIRNVSSVKEGGVGEGR